jgi:hypothetical protein
MDNGLHKLILRSQSTSVNNINLLMYGLILLIFIIDIVVPNGIAIGFLYSVPVLLSLFYRTIPGPYRLAFVCSAFIIIGYFFSYLGEEVWYSVINRILSLAVVWLTALLVAQWNLLEENREKALNEIKVLRGFLPICASCKKIRDDEGYWHQLEVYVTKHSEAEFSHGICPDCMRKLYPKYADKVLDHFGEGQEAMKMGCE